MARPARPATAQVHRYTVHAARRLSPGFARVTLRGRGGPGDLDPVGHDQWFRLFLPGADGSLTLPDGPADGWYRRWQAIPEAQRPVVRNYTVREARPVPDAPDGVLDLDVDLVLHAAPNGEVQGAAARWALDALEGDRLGEEVGVLDQGRLFAAEQHAGPVLVLADESGLPGVEGIARSLADADRADVVYLLEVPHDDDRRPLPGVRDEQVTWVVRPHGQRVGEALLGLLATRTDLGPTTSLYAAGEADLALGARRAARAAGVPDEQIEFCHYWSVARSR